MKIKLELKGIFTTIKNILQVMFNIGRRKHVQGVYERETPPLAQKKSLKKKIFAIVNQKGGVGKSTTAVNLSAYLAQAGFEVLLVDVDPQGNATSGLGLNNRRFEFCIYNTLIEEKSPKEIITKTKIEHLFAIPSTINLAGAEIELVSVLARENKLKGALHDIKEEYDYIIIDCPPSLGLLTVNALVAADEVIIPIQCEYYALEGLSKLLDSIHLVQKQLNPALTIAGVLMTMHDPRTKLSQQVVEEVVKYFQDKVYRTIIPRSVRLSEAPSFGQPINIYDSQSKGAEAYQELAKEVIERG